MGDLYTRTREPSKPPAPLKPANKHELRMAQRGMDAGYLAGRYGGTPLERRHAARECPYPEKGRPRALWNLGYRHGHERGAAELRAVRYSYTAALALIDGPRTDLGPRV